MFRQRTPNTLTVQNDYFAVYAMWNRDLTDGFPRSEEGLAMCAGRRWWLKSRGA